MCLYLHPSPFAGVVKLVDTLDLGSSASRRGGSSPFTRTLKTSTVVGVFYFPAYFLTKTLFPKSLVREL